MTSRILNTAELASKKIYVYGAAKLRGVAIKSGLLGWLQEKSTKNRNAHWLLSLFYIHDIDGLLALEVPWWTYDAIRKTEDFLSSRSDTRVFEFGSGASTIWLAHRADRVVSIEHDSNWFTVVKGKLATIPNRSTVDYHLVTPSPKTETSDSDYGSSKAGHERHDFKTYATSILNEEGLFDLIVIDGRARDACLKHAVKKIKPDGLIVFDNSSRKRYQHAIKISGLITERLKGRVPSLPYPDETTLLWASSP